MAPPIRRLNVKGAAARGRAEAEAVERERVKEPLDSRKRTIARPVKRTTMVSLRQAGQPDPTQEAQEAEEIAVRRLSGPIAHVRFGAGLTINLGNFESARIDVQVELPCEVDGIETAMEEASDFVSTRLAEEEARWATK